MAVQRLTSLAEGASAPATCPKGPVSLWHAADELGLLKIWTVEVSDSRSNKLWGTGGVVYGWEWLERLAFVKTPLWDFPGQTLDFNTKDNAGC